MSALFARLREVMTASSFLTFPSLQEAEQHLRASALASLARGQAVNAYAAIIDQADAAAVLVLLGKRNELGAYVALVATRWKLAEGPQVLAWLATRHPSDFLLTITNDTNDVDLSVAGSLLTAAADRSPTDSN